MCPYFYEIHVVWLCKTKHNVHRVLSVSLETAIQEDEKVLATTQLATVYVELLASQTFGELL